MSWSVSAEGEPKEVLESLEKQFAGITYLTGPEKGLKEVAANLIADTVLAFDKVKVAVSANGHAGINIDQKYQNLNISVKPIWPKE